VHRQHDGLERHGLEQHGQKYLFARAADSRARWSLWASC
jgi:hypothetical protein